MELTNNDRGKISIGQRLARLGRGMFAQQETAIIIPFVALFLWFWSRNDAMVNPNTLNSILRTMAFPGLISMGMVQLMIAGEIDLSTGAMMSLAAVLTAKLIRDTGLTIPQAVVCTMIVSLLVGLLNAVLTVKVGIPAVITTIGTQFMVRGVSYSFTNGLPIYPLPKEVGYLGSLKPFGISVTFFLMLGLVVVVQILLNRTRWGSALFATGANKSAAEICGINTFRVKTICFMLTALLAGMAGMLTMSQIPGTPGDPIIGRNLEFDTLAGIIIGGVSLQGGRGSALGTLLGVMFIQLVRSGLIIGHFNPYLATPSLGILMTLAASVDILRYQRSEH
ncbi:MAG: ABC transporter permease [Chloroflexi bacterium]|nr:ABC transporter permease [Chloroflexota bacterium]